MSTCKLLLFAVLPCLLAAQTTVSLTTTPNPSIFGAPVVLTASVATFNGAFSAPATTGRVTFYDGVTVLGAATVASGSASLSTILLPAGSRKLRAYYAGDAPATSRVVAQTVNANPVSNFVATTGFSTSSGNLPFVADFNGDGIADVALSGAFGVSVLLGDGNGNFHGTVVYAGNGYVSAVGDFNGDGKADLVISDGDVLRVLPGNGTGFFQLPVNNPGVPAFVLTPVVADFNGDGRADLAGGFGVLLGNGDGTFQHGASLGSFVALAVGDFNGDGIPDIATGDAVGTLTILLGNGDGTFRPATPIPVPGNTFSLVAADFNGDGKDDLAAICYNGNQTLQILLAKGDGTFQTAASMPVSSAAFSPGDFNGDGKIDLDVGGLLLAGNGDGTFQPLFSFIGNFGAPVIADVNGDGRPDLVFNNGKVLLGTTTTITASGGTPQSAGAGTQFAAPLEVTVRDDHGLPASGVTVTFTALNSSTLPAATATLSSNTAVTNSSGVASVTATANNVRGSYPVQAVYQSRIASFSLANIVGAAATLTAPGALPQSTAIDTPFGKPLAVSVKDLGGNPVSGATVVFQAPQSGAAAVLSSTTAVTDTSGAASVTAAANHTPGSYTVTATVGALSVAFPLSNTLALPSAVTLAAAASTSVFGAPVLLTATVTPSNATGRVTFYDGVTILGTKPLSTGTASISTILLPSGTRKLRAFYGGDLSYASSTSNVTTQRVNATAGGSFVPLSLLNVSTGNVPVVVADFNGDGRADIAYSSGAAVAVLLGKGDGSFQPPISSPGVAGFMAAGDFNGDGIPDLYSGGNSSSSPGTVLMGNGDGTFRLGSTYPYIYGPVSVADFNGDGNADVLIANTILLGHGDGTFTPQSSFAVPFANLAPFNSIGQSAASDFNGDGKPEIVALAGACVSSGGPISGTTIRCSQSLDLYPGTVDGTSPFPNRHFASASSIYTTPGITSGLPSVFSGSTLYGFALADFNGDRNQDLVYWGSSLTDGLTVLLGNGDGTFGSPLTINTSVLAVATGDFNGDGITDIAINNGDGSFSVLTVEGDGTFQYGSTYSGLDTNPGALMVADFNGDGKADLLVNNAGGIRIFLGAASGNGLAMTATGGTPQTTAIGAAFSAPLEVTLRNNEVPVSGATVTFAPRGGGASATLSSTTAITNASGVARVTATANQNPGAYVVTARSQGVGASFLLTNLDVSVTIVSGTPQSTPVGAAFPLPLKVRVVTGSPPTGAPGVVVTFTAPASGASAILSSPTAVTDASGIASITAAAYGIAGSYGVSAIAGSQGAQFLLTNTAGGGGTTNLAFGKPATQSSTLPGTPDASVAVDGSTDGAFFDGSVTATNLNANAWWQVDLGASAPIASVTIWNRTDCCANRLSDYWVFISNTPFLATDTPATLQNRAGTFANHQLFAPNPSAAIAAGVQGRYVRVQLSGTDYLSLAEVQVAGTAGSTGPVATQSSSYPGSPAASAAIDGNTSGIYSSGSVTATNLDTNAWWQEDLGASTTISSIVIWNRTDCCGSRLSDYWVFVSDTPFLATDTPATLQNRAGTFASHQTTAPNPSTTITLSAQGRYVRVQLSGADYLSLAEVQVFGTGAPAISNVAQGKAAAQSSTLTGAPTAAASSAVDGNADGNFYDGSVTATNLDPNPWWQVDLGVSRSISSIAIDNRTDCCGSRLSDYWVFVSDTPFLATDTPATLQNRAGTFASHQTTAPNPSTSITNGVQGRYVRVQLSSANYLSLAEVQVFGQ